MSIHTIQLQSNFTVEDEKKEMFLSPPRNSWKDQDKHFSNAITDEWFNLIFKLQGEIVYAVYDYFREKGFMPALAPITAQSVTSPMGLGSDSLPVSVELFDKKTYLMDSMQFHLEYLLRQYPAGVFYIMPTFRGEDADARHLNEFFHIEAEFLGTIENNIHHIENLLQLCVNRIMASCSDQILKYTHDLQHLTHFIGAINSGGLPRIKFKDAVSVLGDDPSFYTFYGNEIISLTSAGEKKLMRQQKGPVWLTHLPTMGVPFYQADSEEQGYSLCADLLIGIGETVGCGQRHQTHAQTMNAMAIRMVEDKAYDWYLRMKKDRPLQTSGFGIGLERLLLWILKYDDIRDMQIIVRQKGFESIL